jgi:hypothetical protein
MGDGTWVGWAATASANHRSQLCSQATWLIGTYLGSEDAEGVDTLE